MKMYTLFILIALSFQSLAQGPQKGKGQHKKQQRAKIEQLRKTYINSELRLSKQDSIQFWPVYDSFNTQFRTYKKEVRSKMKKISQTDDISDQEAEKLLKEVSDLEVKIATLKTKSNKEIAAIIGYAKTAQLPEIERAFKKKLLEELKDRRRS